MTPLRTLAKRIVAAVLTLAGSHAAVPADAVPIRLISAPTLSPDGTRMAFEWTGDLWTAPSDGGEAKRLTRDPGREVFPRFTPDGSRIVFSADRSGSLQVYSMPASGGETIRHTHHTEGCELECLSPDGKRAIVRGIRERSGYLATRLMEISLTDDRRELRLFDATAHSASWSPDGARVLFCRGGEHLYRKGFRGSRASQIWLYQIADRRFQRMSAGDSEARSPLWLPDGKGFYFTDNRSGTANLWLQKDSAEARQLTSFDDDGVITPDLSADGSTLVFRVGLGVYRFRPETDPAPVALELWTRESLPDISTWTIQIDGTVSADFTTDLKQVVFSAGGDLWRIDQAGGPASRLTETPAAEEEVRISPDGSWLYFLRDDGLEANYSRARFQNGNLLDESPVTRGGRSKSSLKPSPDGSRIAWIEGTGDLFTAAADGTNPRLVFKCWDKPTFDWSPDGKWLAIAAHDPQSNRDIWLAPADASGQAVNLTRHPAFEGSPKWSPDGRFLVFTSRRDPSGESRLNRIDFGKQRPALDLKDVAVETIDTRGIEPVRVIWSADSKSLLFQSARESTKKLYEIGVDGKGLRDVAEQRGVPIRITPEGNLLWRVDRTPEILTTSGAVRFPISMTVKRPRDEVLALGFRRIWRILGERFYDPAMNGRDWQAMRLKYESAARTARDSRQFDRVISFLRGELNASHLAFHHKTWPEESRKMPAEEKTAHPGLVFHDDGPADGPLRIARVIPGSPVALLDSPPEPGDIVARIAGVPVSARTPLHKFLNGAEKRPLPVVLRSSNGRERVIELRCISYQKARTLDRQDRENLARMQVTHSRPDATYLIVPNMNRNTLDQLAIKIYQASLGSKGLILDFRNNGGGREADRMLNLFCQPAHSYTIPRDGPRGYPVDRRPAPAWNGPLVVLCNQNTYSNAEIFCHAVKFNNRAPLVGTATAGGVISAVNATIPDVGELQVPFRGWHHAGTGRNLDLNGAPPDHPVDLTPADEDAGRDPQLAKAIEVLGK
jgi:tricorn protease